MSKHRAGRRDEGRGKTEDRRQKTEDRGQGTEETTSNKKFLQGGLNQSVSGSVGQLDDWQAKLGISLIMMPRPHPETNENQHKRFAQHIGSPRRGAPGRRRYRK